jgi:hypothetical protein
VSAKAGKERDALVAAYREGLGVVAIVVAGDGSEIRVAADQDIPDEACECWWCRNAAEAERVVAGAKRSAARADARASLLRAAKRLNVNLRSDRDIADEAAIVIDRVAAEFEQFRHTGGLRPVNTSYRDYRLAAAARGERVVPYAQWMRAYRENLVRKAASTLKYL